MFVCFNFAGPTVKFTDEIEAVRREVESFKSAGVEVIIGLSHSGYGMDKKVAAEVDDIDVIVGGHSHTFLYTGTLTKSSTVYYIR